MLAGSLTAGYPVRQRADGMMASLRPVRRYLLAAHAAPGRSICIVSNCSDVRGYRTISRNGALLARGPGPGDGRLLWPVSEVRVDRLGRVALVCVPRTQQAPAQYQALAGMAAATPRRVTLRLRPRRRLAIAPGAAGCGRAVLCLRGR
jgi:hypothetical protein